MADYFAIGGTSKDTQYTKDVLDWTKRATSAIHSAGLIVIPNFSTDEMSEEALAVGNYTDGILAEGGFASWSPRPNTTSMNTPPPKSAALHSFLIDFRLIFD